MLEARVGTDIEVGNLGKQVRTRSEATQGHGNDVAPMMTARN